eukprot:TRINITY_DN2003_c0_g1_i1.p3 TRINITY_DN2003_c0_g1~~TRINITY_DN2003_c0_g1_i1.p3  ORF type:complete len:151 (+),score=18.34 TRINITY_DN2003_c0_g1_i1:161-613(+)
MGVWGLLIRVALPIPLVLLALMCLPLPGRFRRYIVDFTKNIFDLSLVGNMRLVHVMLMVTGLSFASMIRKTMSIYQQAIPADASPNHKAGMLAEKWRAERNFWISFMCFTLWCLLWAFYRLCYENVMLREQVQKLKPEEEKKSQIQKKAE